MKKIIIIIALIVLLCSFTYALGEAVDSQTIEDDGLRIGYAGGNFIYSGGSNFTASTTYNVENIAVLIFAEPSSVGIVNLTIFKANNTYPFSPNQSAVMGYSNNVDASELPTLKQWYNFSFSTTPELTAGQSYIVVMTKNNLDDTKYINWRMNPTAAGGSTFHNEQVINSFGTWKLWVAGWQFDFITYNGTPATLPTASPSFIVPTPNDGVTNNTNISINMTHNGTDIRYYLYFSTSSNPTTLVISNSTINSYSTSLTTEGNYYYKAQVQNITDGTFSSNTSTRSYSLDTNRPIINSYSLGNYVFSNSMIKTINLTSNIIMTDVDIYSYDTYVDGVRIANVTSLNRDVFSYNLSYPISNLSVGKHSLNVTVHDYLLNSVYTNISFYIVNLSMTYENTVLVGANQTSNLTVNLTGTGLTVNATFKHDNIQRSVSKISDSSYYNASSIFYAYDISNTTETKLLSWNVTFNNLYSISLNATQSVYRLNFGNCSNSSWFNAITFHGRDEENDNNVTMKLNVNFEVWINNEDAAINMPFEYSGSDHYDFCVYPNSTSHRINAIMEYGDGVEYTDRKYYLRNYELNASVHQDIYLYHLNTSLASSIVLTAYNQNTGDTLSDVYIKILRYYPGENIAKVVEIEKTDELGTTLGKMRLGDTFYKYIVEYPSGTIRIATKEQKVLSLAKQFYINLVGAPLSTWDQLQDIPVYLDCIKETKTCTYSWSDSSGIINYAMMRVYKNTGFGDILLNETKVYSSAGTIAYTITEDMAGNSYTAIGYIDTNTGKSLYSRIRDEMIDSVTPLTADKNSRLAALFPLLLLAVVVVFALIDFGAVGVIFGSIIVLVLGSITHILPISLGYVSSLAIMGVILIYKIRQ